MTDSEIDMMISEIDQMAQRIGCRFIPDPDRLMAFRCAQTDSLMWNKYPIAVRCPRCHRPLVASEMTRRAILAELQGWDYRFDRPETIVDSILNLLDGAAEGGCPNGAPLQERTDPKER